MKDRATQFAGFVSSACRSHNNTRHSVCACKTAAADSSSWHTRSRLGGARSGGQGAISAHASPSLALTVTPLGAVSHVLCAPATRPYVRACTHTHTHTRAHTYAHAHAHAHAHHATPRYATPHHASHHATHHSTTITHTHTRHTTPHRATPHHATHHSTTITPAHPQHTPTLGLSPLNTR